MPSSSGASALLPTASVDLLSLTLSKSTPRAGRGATCQAWGERNDGGRSMAISLFETEEDLRKGDETLNAMSPPGEGMGRRTSVEMYEVAADLRM